MAARNSTGFVAALLGSTSFEQIFLNAAIEIYSGEQPASADDPPTGMFLGLITRDGGVWAPGSPANGLQFTRSGRFASKHGGHEWRLRGWETGVAGWFRLRGNAPDTGRSVVAPRLDGAIGPVDGIGNYQLILNTTAITPATDVVVPSFFYSIPSGEQQ